MWLNREASVRMGCIDQYPIGIEETALKFLCRAKQSRFG